MRIVAHLLSVVLLVPGIVIAAALLALDHVIGQPNLLSLFNALLEVAIAFLPIAILSFLLWLAIALLGFSKRYSRAAALSVAAIAIGSAGVMLVRTGTAGVSEHTGVYVPGVCALVIAIWLACTESPDERRT